MPKNPGRVCTQCGVRLTAPCDGADSKCFRNTTIKPKGVKRKLVWIPVLFVLGLLIFGCEPSYYEQIEPSVERYRDTGIITVPNPIDYPWVLTHEVVKIGKNYYIPSCLNNKDTLELVTAPVISFWREPRAAQTFQKCK